MYIEIKEHVTLESTYYNMNVGGNILVKFIKFIL